MLGLGRSANRGAEDDERELDEFEVEHDGWGAVVPRRAQRRDRDAVARDEPVGSHRAG